MISTRYLLVFLLATWDLPARGIATESEDGVPFSVAAVLVHKQAFDRPHDVELQDDLAFVPGKGGSLAIVDVSNPTRPQLIWHQHDAKRWNEAETVLPAGNWMFLGTNDFISIDVRDPGQPVFEAPLSTTPKIAQINGMARRDDIIIAAGKNGVLAAFDIRDPAAASVTAAVNIRARHDIGWPHDVDLYAEYAVVTDPRRFGRMAEPGTSERANPSGTIALPK